MPETNQADSKLDRGRTFRPETQAERRLKYGATVLLTILLAIALLAGVVYLANDFRIRTDTTSNGIYSLKPQTTRLIQNLPEKVKIVGLFPDSSHPKIVYPGAALTANPQAAAFLTWLHGPKGAAAFKPFGFLALK